MAKSAPAAAVVLGIDPGTLITGFGVVARAADGRLSLLESGTIRNRGTLPMPERLRCIHQGLVAVISRHHPATCAIESAFYGKNAQSALKLGQARGVALLTAALYDLPAHEYAPREIKRSVVGNGAAGKQQVQYMVKTILHLDRRPMVLDASDAIAVALCHLQRARGTTGHGRSWLEFVKAHPERVRS